jgi:prepilin-type N-terminal cleavage/methylation domain-containing protein
LHLAFTLIELMIVIGIVAIIVAAGVPPFVKALRKEGLRKAVGDVVEGCSHARAQAILHGAPTEFVIRADGQISVRAMAIRHSEDGSELSANGSSGGSGGGSSTAAANFKGALPDDIAVKFLYVNFQDHMEEPEAHVRFFPNGTSDEFTIILSSATSEQQISLDVITGLAEVKVIK